MSTFLGYIQYDAELAAQNENIASLRKSMEELQETRKLDDEFIEFFRKYGNIEKLDRELLNQLLDHVEYTDKEHVDVFFKFSAERDRILDCANAVLSAEETERAC